MAFMVCKDPADPENGNAVVFSAGGLNIYNKIDGVRTTTPTTPLKKYKAGTAPIGSWTELPGYWTETPKVLVSVKKVPTYFARGRLGQQRFTLSCDVQLSEAPLKYKIKPTLTFYISSGGSGTETVNEILSTNVDWYASQGAVTFVGKSTTPQPGAGTLTVSISWQTRAKSGPIYINNNQCYLWSTNSQIYIDIFKVSGDGTVSVESQRLVNETGIGYGQGIQTRTFTVDLGPEMCSWVVRKETQAASRATGSGYEDMVSFLRLNSYSYTTSAETLTNPTGEVFYLAIGR